MQLGNEREPIRPVSVKIGLIVTVCEWKRKICRKNPINRKRLPKCSALLAD